MAQLSGLSIRALRWYDQIGLLKPAYYSSKGYRLYHEEQILLLQQILFFRELGFKLKDIQRMITSDNFDKIKALCAHKETLKEDMERRRILIETIDKTIFHLKGEKMISNADLYAGFNPKKQPEYEQYLVKYYGSRAEDLILESKKRTANWGSKELESLKFEGNEIYHSLAQCISQEKETDSEEVQGLIQKHCEMIARFYDVSKEIYVSLAELYALHPGFRKFFERHHPSLTIFIGEAMRIYAHKNLN